MITVIDSGGANLSSVLFALDRLGVKSQLSRDPEQIWKSPKLILPGVGAAGAVMKNLQDTHLLPVIRELKQPVLGICLGMQILYAHSEEDDIDCLGLLTGTVQHIAARPDHPVPHMGWNRVHAKKNCPLLPESEQDSHFYFVHSFAAPADEYVQAYANYGAEIPSIVQKENWFGVQFHPERSGTAGAKLLKRFLEL